MPEVAELQHRLPQMMEPAADLLPEIVGAAWSVVQRELSRRFTFQYSSRRQVSTTPEDRPLRGGWKLPRYILLQAVARASAS